MLQGQAIICLIIVTVKTADLDRNPNLYAVRNKLWCFDDGDNSQYLEQHNFQFKTLLYNISFHDLKLLLETSICKLNPGTLKLIINQSSNEF